MTMSIHDIHDKDDATSLPPVNIRMKQDFMTMCRNLPPELKMQILIRCPIGTVKFLRKNKYFWNQKRAYDEAEYGSRAKMYWRPGPKRIIWNPEDKIPFNLHHCKRPKADGMPIEFEISYFWKDLQFCHKTNHHDILRPYRSKNWYHVVEQIEVITYLRYLWNEANRALAATRVQLALPPTRDDSSTESDLES